MIFPGSDRVPDPGKFPVPTGFDPYYIKKIGKLFGKIIVIMLLIIHPDGFI